MPIQWNFQVWRHYTMSCGCTDKGDCEYHKIYKQWYEDWFEKWKDEPRLLKEVVKVSLFGIAMLIILAYFITVKC